MKKNALRGHARTCVATPGPRLELTVSTIERVDIFSAGGGMFNSEYGVLFPRRDLPASLLTSYPELTVDNPDLEGVSKHLDEGFHPVKASSGNHPAIFYLYEDAHANARLADLFRQCEHRQCSLDLLIDKQPATLVIRPVRYTCTCESKTDPTRGVRLHLMAIKLNPWAMGLPTYQDFLDEEEQDFIQAVEENGNDY